MILAILMVTIAATIAAGWMGLRYERQVMREVSNPKAVREYLRQRYTIDE